MDGIIAIIVIIAAISKVVKASKAVKKNAPGQSVPRDNERVNLDEIDERAAKPVVTKRTEPAQQEIRTIQPTVKPVTPDAAPTAGNFWQQVSEALREVQEDEKAAKAGHEAVGKMPEGDSRECEHGSLGGSMAYESHQEGREKKSAPQDRREEDQHGSLYRPAMNASEMRRAVVMAEILKRPGERMAEQARRWSVR